MASAILKILNLDPAKGGFPVWLIEEDESVTEGLLPLAALGQGEWTIELNAVPPPATDIIQKVVTTDGDQRQLVPWATIGKALFNHLLPDGAIRSRWAVLASTTELYLEIEPEELSRVPWEISTSAGPPQLRLALNNSLSRLHIAPSLKETHSRWPLRVLVLVGCPEDDEEILGVRAEVENIEEIFFPFGRSVDVHVMRRPLRTELVSWIKATYPHVLHFCGHAGENAASDPALLIDRNDSRESWEWSATDIQTDLPMWQWVPHFVFLNACRTAKSHAGAWGMHRSFAGAGVRAVLSMQADVHGKRASAFATTFYQHLAEGVTVQKATLEARNAVRNFAQGAQWIDWALPTLTSAQKSLQLFKSKDPPSDPEFAKCMEFNQTRFFADCRDARRLLTRWVCPTLPPPKPPHVFLLTGEPRSGKSHLLKWCMESWAVSGARVRYVELHDTTGRSFLGVLRQIRDGERVKEGPYLHRPLPDQFVRQFNWHLKNLQVDGIAGEWNEADDVGESFPDSGADLRVAGEVPPEKIAGERFHDMLNKVAANQPLILVFDKFSTLEGDRLLSNLQFGQLVDYFLRPIAEDPESRIRVVLCMNHTERNAYKPETLFAERNAYKPETLFAKLELRHQFTEIELSELATEMFWYKERESVKQLAETLLGFESSSTVEKGLARLTAIQQALQSRGAKILDQIKRMR